MSYHSGGGVIMTKLFNKIIASTVSLAIATPVVCLNATSCGNNDVAITKIRLSARYSYIYPGQELKIKAEVFPAGASKDDIKWEVVSPSIEGFTISDNGKLYAPKSYPTSDEPITIQVKATSKTNPEVSTSYDVLATTDTEHELLGFTGGFRYLDRAGNTATRKILSKVSEETGIKYFYFEGTDPTKPYTPEYQHGVPLYAGRRNEFIDFSPVFKTGRNKGMIFELSNWLYLDRAEAISWVNYTNKTVTTNIPGILTVDPTCKQQVIQVDFTAEGENVSFWMYFDVYQNTDINTPSVFGYNPSGTDEDQDMHKVLPRGEGMFATQILCPTSTTLAPVPRRIGDIYAFRKPYEEIKDTIWGKWVKKDDAPDIFTEGGEPQCSALSFTDEDGNNYHLPNNPEYLISKFDVTYTVDPALLAGLDYENYLIGTFYCYDQLDPEGKYPIATLEFRVEWIDQ